MGTYVWPCPNYVCISSPFGPRSDGFHYGVDMACPANQPIIAARPGTVSIAEWNHYSYGNYIQINHGGGIYTLYAHANQLLVSNGATVAAGQKIALVGSTGQSTGAHLHFEIKIDGTKKNALHYVKDSDSLAKYTGPHGKSDSAGNVSSPSIGGTDPEQPQAKEITEIVTKSITGVAGTYKLTALRSQAAVLEKGCEILIQENESRTHMPVVEGEITLQYERKGSPGVLTFNVLKEGALSFHEGNPVSFRVDGQRIFYGFVFTKSRNKNGIITVTCYDQLRYFKNKDTLIYKSKKYSDLVKMMADKYKLKVGTIEDTKHVIEARNEDDSTIFDILGNASDETTLNTGELFVLYDDCGAICLKNIKSMVVPILIDEETAEDYDYTSSIDEQTYTRIVLARDNTDTGQRELYIANDEAGQSRWGILQYYENTGNVGTTSTSSPNATNSGGASGSGGSGSSSGGPTGMSTENRKMGSAGIDMVKKYEGVYLYAYRDPVGIWTIGYGHTKGVYGGQTISQAQADAYLREDMAEFEGEVNRQVKVPVTQNMFDALVSFAFNVGGGALASSDLLQKLNAGDYTGAANEFGRWVYGGGQQLPGLVKRRASERALFLTGYAPGSSAKTRASAGETASADSSNVPDSKVLEDKAKVLLEYYAKKSRSLTVKNVFGDVRVRGGTTIAVALDIGDLIVSNYMVVESITHRFENGKYTMDPHVVGVRGEFI